MRFLRKDMYGGTRHALPSEEHRVLAVKFQLKIIFPHSTNSPVSKDKKALGAFQGATFPLKC